MILRVAPWWVPFLLAAGVAQAAPEQAVIDRARAMQAPVSDLAQEIMATAASRFVEVERPTFSGMAGPNAPLRGLRFATAPRRAGWPGLCNATTVWISVDPSSEPMETATVYKVVGDLTPLKDMWNAAYEAKLDSLCAAAGRVIPAESGDFSQVAFFGIAKGGDDHVWMAALALQRAVAGVKSGLPVTCVPEPGVDEAIVREAAADDPEMVEDRQNREGCAKAAATLAGLQLGRLFQLDTAPCPGAKADIYCLSASFLRFAYGNHQAFWRVELRYREDWRDDRSVDTIEAVTLKPSFAIYD